MKGMIDLYQRVDTLRLDDSLEEVKAVANYIEPKNDYQRGMKTGLNMALKLIEMRINHP
jgi:hypothetical protein